VDSIDIERYTGRWYSIASIPTSFERDCVAGATAEYALLDNGQIKVVNTCYNSDGKEKRATGRAWIPNPKEPTKLKVSFVRILGFWLFPGDYWIIDLGTDYQYAVVGHPSYKYGWILSRTPTLPEATFTQIIARLEEQGYKFEDFRRIDQSIHLDNTEDANCSP
jgi:apolipoprotein D and lipocalin family protein